MASHAFFCISTHIPYQQKTGFKSSPPKSCFSISLPRSSLLKGNTKEEEQSMAEPVCSTKRNLNIAILALITNESFPNSQKSIVALELERLQRYTDFKEGFTLLRPSSYVKVDKAGATVLFVEVNKGSNNVGVVVNPVRLNSLSEFGTPQFVADKLIQAEKRKESTKDAEVIEVTQRSGNGGLQVYEFEYRVDSTRGGMKRIFSAAFVASKKLYLLNITHSDKLESPLDTSTRRMLEEVLHSFDVAPMT